MPMAMNPENLGNGEGIRGAKAEPITEARAEYLLSERTYPGVSQAVIGGCPQHWAQVLDSHQGDNFLGAERNCGWVAASNVMNMAGLPMDEDTITKYAVTHGLCETEGFDLTRWGGSYTQDIQALLDSVGIASQVLPAEALREEALAEWVEEGYGVILNHHVYLSTPGMESQAACDEYGNFHAHHLACITGTVRDGETGRVAGFILCDSWPGDPVRYVSVESMEKGFWQVTGGEALVTRDPIHQGGKPLLQGLMGSTPA